MINGRNVSLLTPNTTTNRMQTENPVTTSALTTGTWFIEVIAEDMPFLE